MDGLQEVHLSIVSTHDAHGSWQRRHSWTSTESNSIEFAGHVDKHYPYIK